MIGVKPLVLIWIGLFLVLLGVVLPFLMVLGLIPSTFFLNLFSFAASVAGLFMGVIGSALYVRLKKDDTMDR